MTRAERVNYLASAAGLLAQTGHIFARPDGLAGLAWTDADLMAILWTDDGDAMVDVFHRNRKVLATRWRPGAKRHEAIRYRRGEWEQMLADAASAWVAAVELEGGALVH